MTNLDRRVLLGVAGIAGMAAINRVARAGSLNPPAGPVTPTMKTLDEVEARTPLQSLPGDVSSLYVISQSGSYYLTGNVTGATGQNGVSIKAPNVTIDLNGFSLLGVAGATNGISTNSASSNLCVINGNISGWPSVGLAAQNSSRVRLENLIVSNCTLGGIFIGSEGLIVNCGAYGCGEFGIQTHDTCRIVNCIAHATVGTGTGIECDYNSVVQDCTCSENSGTGILGNGSFIVVTNCKATGNSLDGVLMNGPYSEVLDTVASRNTLNGVHLTAASCRIDHCSASFNTQSGIVVDAAGESTVTRCTASGNFSFADYSIANNNKAAQIVGWASVALGFTCGDPLANTK